MSSKRREERDKDKDSKDSGEYIFTDLDAAFHLAENTDQTNFKYACAVCYDADIKNLMQRVFSGSMQPIDRSLEVESCGDNRAHVQICLRMQHIYNFKKEGVVCMVVDQDASPEFCEQYGLVSGSPVVFVYNRGKKLLIKRPGFTGMQSFITGQINESKMKSLVEATAACRQKLENMPECNFIEIPW